MLKQRLITATVLSALLLLALFYLSFQNFALVLGVLFAIGAWEWANFAKLNAVGRVLYALFAVGLMVGAWQWLGYARALSASLENKLLILLITAALYWLVACIWVMTYPNTAKQWAAQPVQLLIGFLVLVPAWLSLVFLRSQTSGHWLIIIAAMCVICADTGAYFAGRKWGRNKLAAAVSPGKTKEGFYGGLALSTVFAVIVILSLGRGANDWWLVVIVVASSVVSVFGDLLESMMKRHRGIKDSGIILPGHGGVLDRIDSVTAAAPVFALVYLLSGWSL